MLLRVQSAEDSKHRWAFGWGGRYPLVSMIGWSVRPETMSEASGTARDILYCMHYYWSARTRYWSARTRYWHATHSLLVCHALTTGLHALASGLHALTRQPWNMCLLAGTGRQCMHMRAQLVPVYQVHGESISSFTPLQCTSCCRLQYG